MASKKQEMYLKAQRRLVASLLADGTNTPRVLEIVTAEDFEEPSYHLIFSVMAELARANDKISDLSVGEKLEQEGNLMKAGGPHALLTLTVEGKDYLLDAPVDVYARIVKEAAAKSALRRDLDEAIDAFQDDSGKPAATSVSDLQGVLNERLLRLSDSSTISHFRDETESYFDILERRKEISEENEANEGLQGIPTLLPTLDKYTNGWKPGMLITIGASTGMGKSVMAINCAVAAATSNKSVMFFTLEMSTEEVMDRVISSTTGIPQKHLKTGMISPEEKTILSEQLEAIRDMKLTIDTESKITIDGIRARALRQAQSTDGLDMIVIDYLQLVTPSGRFNSRQEAVADMSRNVKLLAKQLQVPVIVLVQLNRRDNDDDSLPTVDNIRESAAIGHDSDVVILLHRDKVTDGTTPQTLVILEKNRNGESNKVIRCHSILECSIFREVTKAADAEGFSGDDDIESFGSAGSSEASDSFDDDDVLLGSFDDDDDDFELDF